MLFSRDVILGALLGLVLAFGLLAAQVVGNAMLYCTPLGSNQELCLGIVQHDV
jgi:hypothetical protein